MITVEQLQSVISKKVNVNQWYDVLVQLLPTYEINTDKRIAAFLAQCIHESAGFSVLQENLNYSAEGLMKTWPKRFPDLELANAFARNPKSIANLVYANRMGNGDASTGDGWKYCGKGAIQLTGHDNYKSFADHVGMNIDDVGDYLLTPEGAIKSACYFWQKNHLNAVADTGDIDKVSKIVNGGTVGIVERKKLYELLLSLTQ